MPISLTRRMVAEAIGTFALSFIGVLAIATTQGSLATVALAHGFTIAVMVAATAAISGAHLNPAITFAFWLNKMMSASDAVAYWIAQLAGATLAGLLLVVLIGADHVAAGTPQLAAGVSPLAGSALEAVCTFFLAFVVFGTAVDPRAPKSVFPLMIGLTVALDIFAIGPLTGAAMNPSRSFGPALASGTWGSAWVYWVGPFIGAALAALLQKHLLLPKGEEAV